MRIVHVSPELGPGGVRQMAADLACALQARGVDNTVVAPVGKLVNGLAAAGARHASWLGGRPFTAWQEAKRLAALLRRVPADLVLTYSPLALEAGQRACRSLSPGRRPPLVHVLGGFPRGGRSRLRAATGIVALSRHLRQECVKRDKVLEKRPPWVIPYGVDEALCHPRFRPSEEWRNDQLREVPDLENRYTLCLPGALSSLRGLDDLPPLLSSLIRNGLSPHAILVGDARAADPAYLEHLRRKLKDAELAERVTWIAPGDDLREVLASCDVCLSLAHAPAGYDRAILEALALGRPVAGYDHGAVGEMLDSFLPEGRVAPGDVQGMADTLVQWHTYRPALPQQIPYPYRLADTALNFIDLFHALLEPTRSPFEGETAAQPAD